MDNETPFSSDLNSLIAHSKTMNLSPTDRNQIRSLVHLFIDKSEIELSKYGKTDQNLKAKFSSHLKAYIRFFENGVSNNNHSTMMQGKFRQIANNEFNSPPEERMGKFIRFFYTSIAVEIFLHFLPQINQWLSKYRGENNEDTKGKGSSKGVGVAEQVATHELIEFVVQRIFKKLQVRGAGQEITRTSSSSTDDIIKNFIGKGANNSSGCCGGCSVFKNNSKFKNIFVQPIPALLCQDQKQICVEQGMTQRIQNSQFSQLIRPPFKFEHEGLSQNSEIVPIPPCETASLLEPTNFVCEDSLPLAIVIFEEIQKEIGVNKIYQHISYIMSAEMSKEELTLREKIEKTPSSDVVDFNGLEAEPQEAVNRSQSQKIRKIHGLKKAVDGFLNHLIVSKVKNDSQFNASELMETCLRYVFTRIRDENKTNGEEALELLHLISFLEVDHVTPEVCYRFYDSHFHHQPNSGKINHSTELGNNTQIVKLLNILARKNLITITNHPDQSSTNHKTSNQKIRIQPLVQITTRQILSDNENTMSIPIKYFCISFNCQNETETFLYNTHLCSILDHLFTDKSSTEEISLAASIVSSKISTQNPFYFTKKTIKKIDNFYNNINCKIERLEETAILEVVLDFLKINERELFSIQDFENLLEKVVKCMKQYPSNIFMQFVGCNSMRYVLCDHPMRSLVSCETYKKSYEWCLEFFLNCLGENNADSVHFKIQRIWIPIFENLLLSFASSEMLFIALDPAYAVELLVTKYTEELETNVSFYWGALYSAMYGSKHLPGYGRNSGSATDAEMKFMRNSGINNIAKKLKMLADSNNYSSEQIRIVFGLIIQLSQNADFAKEFINSVEFMTLLRSCINSFSNNERRVLHNAESHSDIQTSLKLATICYSQIWFMSQKHVENENSRSNQKVVEIGQFEQDGLCWSPSCDFCEKHSRECVQSLLNTFVENNRNNPSHSKQVEAADRCLVQRRRAQQPQRSQTHYHIQSSSPAARTASMDRTPHKHRRLRLRPLSEIFHSVESVSDEDGQQTSAVTATECINRQKAFGLLQFSNERNTATPTTTTTTTTLSAQEKERVEEAYKNLVNWIRTILSLSVSTLGQTERETELISSSKWNFNLQNILLSEKITDLAQWPAAKLTHLISIAVSTILKNYEPNNVHNLNTTTTTTTNRKFPNVKFSYKALCSIKWFHHRHQKPMSALQTFLIHVGLVYYLIYINCNSSSSSFKPEQYQNSSNSNQAIFFHRSRQNFVQWALKEMGKFSKTQCELDKLALRLGSLAIYEGTAF